MARNPTSANANLTDAAGPGAGRTNPGPPVYDNRPPPKTPPMATDRRGDAQGHPIPRDPRKLTRN